MKKYLPSKNSTYLIIVCTFIALGVVLMSKFFFGSNKMSAINKQNQSIETVANLTVNNLLQKDTDGDGIPDWEEALWGTDPNKTATFDGILDATYIKNKKDALQTASGVDAGANTSPDTTGLNETDKFARQFFATYLALKQSGQADANTINGIAASLGQNIISAILPNKYGQADITLDAGGKSNDEKYFNAVQDLFKNYQTTRMGEEIDILAQVAGNDTATLDQKAETVTALDEISNNYQDFAKKMMYIPVPSELIVYHLKIANSANNTGISVGNLTKAIDDPIVGLSGLAEYQQYSENLISAANDLKTYLTASGILIK